MSSTSPCLFLIWALPLAGVSAQNAQLPEELPIHSRFAERVSAEQPHPEHPRPQMFRRLWRSLNGMWEFSTEQEGDYESRIRVPFAPETALSGLMKGQEIMETLRYRRVFAVPGSWQGGRILLHFEAVDWQARVTCDGKEAGSHRGGYDRFSFDITDLLNPEADEHVLEVEIWDPADPDGDGWQPRGKQLGSRGIWYTRTTGIWQSVWLEAVPDAHFQGLDIRADAAGQLRVAVETSPAAGEHIFRLVITGEDEHGTVFRKTVQGPASQPLALNVDGVRPWSPDDPYLYSLELQLLDDAGGLVDLVRSYAGFRTVAIADGRWLLNGERLFLRGVLDQGYWPAGGLTAPSDEALRADVELTKQLGLNLSRKHVKVESDRYYYHCDLLGLLVMQDMPSSRNLEDPAARENFLRELEGMVGKLRNHPSVVHWVAFNENWGRPGAFQDQTVQHLRQLDPTRTVTDASGWNQRQDTDITDVHDYGGDLLRHGEENPSRPKLIGECGGVAFSLAGHRWTEGWGYTQADTQDLFLNRINRLVQQIYEAPGLMGFVWTQLTDVEQELNGLVHYDRTPKADIEAMAAIIRGRVPLPPRIGVAQWLVLGPIPAGTSIENTRGSEASLQALAGALDRAWLPDEAAPSPEPGAVVVIDDLPFTWREASSPRDMLDLGAYHGEDPDNCVSYAVGILELPEPSTARLLFGSDDAARIWINGVRVHDALAVRGVTPAQDAVAGIELATRNLIVVKVAQGAGGFGFSLFFEEER